MQGVSVQDTQQENWESTPSRKPKLGPVLSTQTVSFKEFLLSIRERLWLIVIVTIICVGVTTGLSLTQDPTYEASVLILVSKTQDSNPTDNLQGDIQGSRDLTQTMAETVATRPIADRVIQQLDLDISTGELLSNTRASQVKNTQLIQITYADVSAQRAQQIANTIGDVYSEQISDTPIGTINNVGAEVWERADVPGKPVSPNILYNVGVALAIGLLLSIGLAIVLNRIERRGRMK